MPGYILNEDDSNATQLTTFLPQTSGVFLAHLEQALPRLRENAVLSKDELGITVITRQQLETMLAHQSVTIPCDIPGADPIILAGTLVQSGEKIVEMQGGQSQAD